MSQFPSRSNKVHPEPYPQPHQPPVVHEAGGMVTPMPPMIQETSDRVTAVSVGDELDEEASRAAAVMPRTISHSQSAREKAELDQAVDREPR